MGRGGRGKEEGRRRRRRPRPKIPRKVGGEEWGRRTMDGEIEDGGAKGGRSREQCRGLSQSPACPPRPGNGRRSSVCFRTSSRAPPCTPSAADHSTTPARPAPALERQQGKAAVFTCTSRGAVA
ncbi:hypothetical protein B0H10DRAFT_1665 [Mycena sp. CBHHK59/15]|nr:hypothetical protein B0H10DRAFT_1665 [Mycena sp. CBHHK59/15]